MYKKMCKWPYKKEYDKSSLDKGVCYIQIKLKKIPYYMGLDLAVPLTIIQYSLRCSPVTWHFPGLVEPLIIHPSVWLHFQMKVDFP